VVGLCEYGDEPLGSCATELELVLKILGKMKINIICEPC
jgi:hypothetical protein